MKIHDFITLEEIKEVAESIKNKKDFRVVRIVKNYKFKITNGEASTDYRDGTKEGDYIVSISLQTKNKGRGSPVSGKELKGLEKTENLIEFIDNYLKWIDGYESKDKGQMDLFMDLRGD